MLLHLLLGIWYWGSNPKPHSCKTCALPLSYYHSPKLVNFVGHIQQYQRDHIHPGIKLGVPIKLVNFVGHTQQYQRDHVHPGIKLGVLIGRAFTSALRDNTQPLNSSIFFKQFRIYVCRIKKEICWGYTQKVMFMFYIQEAKLNTKLAWFIELFYLHVC